MQRSSEEEYHSETAIGTVLQDFSFSCLFEVVYLYITA
jgi:hypothetical protein